MGYIRRSDLGKYYSTKINQEGFKQLSNYIHRRRNFSYDELQQKNRVSVYLSHCPQDEDLIIEAIAFLAVHGGNIYVDWKDRSMPKVRNPLAAKKLKSKIIENKKFILLASDEAIDSSWLPWELGFADPYKYIRNMAILPVADNEGIWEGADYLSLYPKIESVQAKGEEECFVNFGGGHRMKFIDWLNE